MISLIVPVYNAKNYLNRCIESILSQTYSNFELILVNDGSTDESEQICSAFQQKDARVRLINQNNMGPGKARETGVKNSLGDFIGFIDADDYISVNYLELLYAAIIKNNADIVKCNYQVVTENCVVIHSSKYIEIELFNNFECMLYFVQQKHSSNYLWDKLYTRRIFEGVVFPNFFAGEDYCILSQLFSNAKRFVTIDDTLYSYVRTDDSLCRRPFSISMLDNIKAGKFVFDYLSSTHPSLIGYAAAHICSYSSRMYFQIESLSGNKNEKERIRNLLLSEFQNNYNVFDNANTLNISFGRKSFIFIFHYSPLVAGVIMKLYDFFNNLKLSIFTKERIKL
jgi:glycosyltransferase involved in cell wall biosynthesis